jgi:hypothetical protein
VRAILSPIISASSNLSDSFFRFNTTKPTSATMRFFQLATLVALFAGSSVVAVPNREGAIGRDSISQALKSRDNHERRYAHVDERAMLRARDNAVIDHLKSFGEGVKDLFHGLSEELYFLTHIGQVELYHE